MLWLLGDGTCQTMKFVEFVGYNSMGLVLRANILVMIVLYVSDSLRVAQTGTDSCSDWQMRPLVSYGTIGMQLEYPCLLLSALSYDLDTTRFLEGFMSHVQAE
jgi:hypothetical protein